MREEVFLDTFAECGESIQENDNNLQSTKAILFGSCSLWLSVIKTRSPGWIVLFALLMTVLLTQTAFQDDLYTDELYTGLSKNDWKPGHWSSSAVCCPNLWHPSLVRAFSTPPWYSFLLSVGRQSKRCWEKQREVEESPPVCSWRSLERRQIFLCSRMPVHSSHCVWNRVLGRRVFKITFLRLCNHHVMLKVSMESPSEKQICYIFPL